MMGDVVVSEEMVSDQVRIIRRVARSWSEAERELSYFDSTWVFRGQCNAQWGIRCNLDRLRGGEDPVLAEMRIREEFVSRAHLYFSSNREPDTLVEWLALIQHHGGPSRLIDFTRAPLVAAFFALREESDCDTCAVWALQEFACHTRAMKRLIQIDSEFAFLKPQHSLESAIEAQLKRNVMAPSVAPFAAPIRPSRLNARMALQQGLFMCHGDPGNDRFANLKPDVQGEEPLDVVRIEFPRRDRGRALQALRRFNISRDTLFPGLDGLAQSLAHLLVPLNLHQETLLTVLGRPVGWPRTS